jgi:DNA polymerase III epsilon subunit-like protein
MATTKLLPPNSFIAFFDLETTIPAGDGNPRRIIQVGIAIVDMSRMAIVKRVEYNVGGPEVARLVSEHSVRTTHLSSEEVRRAPIFATVAREIFDVMNGLVWAGHNIVNFDIPTLRYEYELLHMIPPVPTGILDTLITIRSWRKEETHVPFPTRLALASIAEFLGMSDETHTALDDAILSFEAIERMCAASTLRRLLYGYERQSLFTVFGETHGRFILAQMNTATAVPLQYCAVDLVTEEVTSNDVDFIARRLGSLALTGSRNINDTTGTVLSESYQHLSPLLRGSRFFGPPELIGAVLNDTFWCPVSRNDLLKVESDSAKRHFKIASVGTPIVLCELEAVKELCRSGDGIEALARALGADAAFPHRRNGQPDLPSGSVAWFAAIIVAVCARKLILTNIRRYITPTSSPEQHRLSVVHPHGGSQAIGVAKARSAITDAAAAIAGRFRFNRLQETPPEGKSVQATITYRAHDKANAVYFVLGTPKAINNNMFEAVDLTPTHARKVKTFAVGRVEIISSIFFVPIE